MIHAATQVPPRVQPRSLTPVQVHQVPQRVPTQVLVRARVRVRVQVHQVRVRQIRVRQVRVRQVRVRQVKPVTTDSCLWTVIRQRVSCDLLSQGGTWTHRTIT